MSLIVDLTTWVNNKLNSMAITLTCTIILALFLYTTIPDMLRTHSHMRNQNGTNHSNIQQNAQTRLILQTHAHLANTLGVSKEDIIFNGITNKTWTDTSLECPRPYNNNKPLVQVPIKNQVPGWLISWKLGNTIYEYNTSTGGEWVLCNKIEIPKNIYQYRSPASDSKIL